MGRDAWGSGYLFRRVDDGQVYPATLLARSWWSDFCAAGRYVSCVLPPDPNDEQRQSEQKSEGENQDQQSQEMVNRDEKREALEQWLRRVPDEPGGLLRRKFQHETKQRLRDGNYEHRQGEKVW